jgi:predicted negative regulator of RcsB-dependent stress response
LFVHRIRRSKKAVARIQRQELKHDEFVDSVEETLLWFEDNARTLALVALTVVVGGGSVGGFYWHSKKQETKAGVALADALVTYQAPVQAGLPALPGEGPQQSFASEQEKYTAAEKEFAGVVEEYPRTRAGRLAQHYHALCLFELGKTDEAIASLRDLSLSADKNTAAMVKLSLAGFHRKLGQREEAAQLLQELADNPTATVPRATALLELATLKSDADPAEARRIYNEIKTEFADTPVEDEVTRRLEFLPPPPPESSTSGSQP